MEVIAKLITADSSQIADDIDAIVQMEDITNTYTALEFVNTKVYPLLQVESTKILITMTDGSASDSRSPYSIRRAHSNFDVLISVGVGSNLNKTQLADFSSSGLDLTVGDFTALEGIISEIVEKICSSIETGRG